jgi:hypothetical protein
MRSTQGEETRDKIDKLVDEYWNPDVDRLRQELRAMEAPLLSSDQRYFLEKMKNEASGPRQWLKDSASRPAGVRPPDKNNRFVDDDLKFLRRVHNIFTVRGFRSAFDNILIAADINSWTEDDKQSTGIIDVAFPSDLTPTPENIRNHLAQACLWTRTYIEKTASPFLERAVVDQAAKRAVISDRTAKNEARKRAQESLARHQSSQRPSGSGGPYPPTLADVSARMANPPKPKRTRTDSHQGILPIPEEARLATSTESNPTPAGEVTLDEDVDMTTTSTPADANTSTEAENTQASSA